MTTISTRAPARRKTKSVTKPTHLTYELRRKKAKKEILDFMEANPWDSPAMKIVGHVCPWGDPVTGIKEIRRLLGESIAKCKVIPFPVGGKRGLKISKGA
ncbi:hypothetical protein [Nitrosomonas ureae]|uniref:Uncharacterized protein n=1 Tax=Nitrosomonas ureae TaxID=44577 RepID=A0A1H2HKU1_9PROT|nr:hypothetical protein [Nitrosomonas ureae]ALQ51156.1 hypothetical protein ATY38_07915 [Nitrosomonas ureae]SDU32349.1 hypothetical protein SAMN05216406_15315 [Nitrosomonas ureae]